jgi:SNF2 family DNA or RNA helicase
MEELRGRDIDDIADLLRRIQCLERQGRTVNIYRDAEEFIHRRLLLERVARRVAEIRIEPESHPLRRQLLKAELLPYQLDGIAFAAGAGRAVLADEMGLGKTIQAIGVSELLAREAGISKVLVICPASVKSQWRNEIRRFCDRDCQLISGSTASRSGQYANDCFFTVCNYEQVLRDILSIERMKWDFIILDEGQRIKNWEAKTSRITRKRFLNEMDLFRLRKHLLMCRMSADGTFLVDKQAPGYSSKLDELDNLFDRLFSEEDRKVLLFSEWTTMLDLIEPLLKKRRLSFVRLDGSVPQKLRPGLVHEFQSDPVCRLFLTTNAGSTGLNLQAANTVINVDLPWNPAVLEQRCESSRSCRRHRRTPPSSRSPAWSAPRSPV